MNIKNLKNFVDNKNKKKIIFTAGPSSLVPESIYGITPCFGRNDKDYIKTENNVLNKLKTISGHRNIARMQGSGSFALEKVYLILLLLMHIILKKIKYKIMVM